MKPAFRKDSTRRFFFQYLFFFLLVMAIPVFSQSMSNLQVRELLQGNAEEQTLASLRTAASGVDRVRQDVGEHAVQYGEQLRDLPVSPAAALGPG